MNFDWVVRTLLNLSINYHSEFLVKVKNVLQYENKQTTTDKEV